MSSIKLPSPNKTENIYGDDYRPFSSVDTLLTILGSLVIIVFIILEIFNK